MRWKFGILSPEKNTSSRVPFRGFPPTPGAYCAEAERGRPPGASFLSRREEGLRAPRRAGCLSVLRRTERRRGDGHRPERELPGPWRFRVSPSNPDVSFDQGTNLLCLARHRANSGCSILGHARRVPGSVQVRGNPLPIPAPAGSPPPCNVPQPWGTTGAERTLPLLFAGLTCTPLHFFWLALPPTLLVSVVFFQKSCSSTELLTVNAAAGEKAWVPAQASHHPVGEIM